MDCSYIGGMSNPHLIAGKKRKRQSKKQSSKRSVAGSKKGSKRNSVVVKRKKTTKQVGGKKKASKRSSSVVKRKKTTKQLSKRSSKRSSVGGKKASTKRKKTTKRKTGSKKGGSFFDDFLSGVEKVGNAVKPFASMAPALMAMGKPKRKVGSKKKAIKRKTGSKRIVRRGGAGPKKEATDLQLAIREKRDLDRDIRNKLQTVFKRALAFAKKNGATAAQTKEYIAEFKKRLNDELKMLLTQAEISVLEVHLDNLEKAYPKPR